ncbi:MAG: tetratricopeptide repeat protein [Terriglobales bacterium]
MAISSSAKAAKRGKKARGAQSSNASHLPERQTLWTCLALIAAVFAAYSPVIHNGLVYDDNFYITQNAHVKAGLTWSTVGWAFTTYEEANWHPLTWLSHALDCDLFGLNPAGPHGVNVLLHAANAVLLFLLLRSATGFRWRSLMVAALFALHPINVESVAWAAERKNVLSMLFFLLAFYAYLWYTRQRGLARYMAVAGLYAMALMSKPQVITFPFLLLLWDYWPLGRIGTGAGTMQGRARPESSIARLVLEKVPLLLLSAASAAVTIEAQKAGGAVRTLTRYTVPVRLETVVISYVDYVGKLFWPSRLVALYPHPTHLYPLWQVGAGAFALLLMTAVAILRARRQRYLAVGWFWFLGSLVPMIGLIQVGDQAMADRYAYISFIGLFVMMVWLVADVTCARRISAPSLAVPAVCLLVVLGILTYRQVHYWHDAEFFWRRTVELTHDNYKAHEELAYVLHDQGKTEEAIEHIRAALAIRPEFETANLLLAEYEETHGNSAAAIDRLQRIASGSASAGGRAKAYADLGFIYQHLGKSMKAKQAFEASLQLSPDTAFIMVALGVVDEQNGDLPEAVQQYSRAVSAQPTDVELLLLAHALEQEGRTDEANAARKRAARASPNLAQAQQQAQALLGGK